MLSCRVRLLCILAVLPAAAKPQRTVASADSTFTAAHIKFQHAGTFAQADLETAAALHPGDKFKVDDLTAAAQRLSDTGYFDTVSVAVDGNGTQVTVVFGLKPFTQAQLIHASFQNFLALPQADLLAAIHAKVPLFDGYLPESGGVAESIDTALTAALTAKGFPYVVNHETVEPSLIQPERLINFAIVKPALRVAAIHLAGVSAPLAPFLQKSVNATAKTAYNDGLAGTRTSTRILEPLLDAGYAHASLSGITVTPQPVTDGTVPVDLAATLTAGEVFRVSAITFTGSPLVTADAFAATQKLHTGDIASRKALLETLAPLDDAYRRQGYLDVIVNAPPVADPAGNTLSYIITITPGEQYRLKDITIQGLDTAARADFDTNFRLHPGDLYNPLYVAEFLKNNSSLQKLNGYRGQFKASADPITHTVALLVQFYR